MIPLHLAESEIVTDDMRAQALARTARTMKKLNKLRKKLKLPRKAISVIAEVYGGHLMTIVDSTPMQGWSQAVPYPPIPPMHQRVRPIRRTENLGIFGTHEIDDDDGELEVPARMPFGFGAPPFPMDCCGVPPMHEAHIGADGMFRGGPPPTEPHLRPEEILGLGDLVGGGERGEVLAELLGRNREDRGHE